MIRTKLYYSFLFLGLPSSFLMGVSYKDYLKTMWSTGNFLSQSIIIPVKKKVLWGVRFDGTGKYLRCKGGYITDNDQLCLLIKYLKVEDLSKIGLQEIFDKKITFGTSSTALFEIERQFCKNSPEKLVLKDALEETILCENFFIGSPDMSVAINEEGTRILYSANDAIRLLTLK